MADWHLVVRPDADSGSVEVWLSSDPKEPENCANSIIIGGGLTRRAALLSAHKELLAQAARVAYELGETTEARR